MERLGSLRIDKRFCGPPSFGNGGYSCGLLAKYLHHSAPDDAPQIRLLAPVPLEETLDIWRLPDASLALQHGGDKVASCYLSKLRQQTPAPLDFSQAEQIAKGCYGLQYHPFPECFVCGPQRLPGDGLRIFPGRLHKNTLGPDSESEFQHLVTAPWTPDSSLAKTVQAEPRQRTVDPEFIWAALDCTGSFPIDFSADKVLVLGQFKVRLTLPVYVGEKCVVMGWLKSIDGRKHFTETALFNSKKEVCGLGQAIWIQLQK